MTPSPTPSSSSITSCDSADAFAATLDLETIQALALATRRAGVNPSHPQYETFACTVVSPPKSGAFNVVYELRFTDGVRWALRIPFQEWNSTRAHSMSLDILAQQYIIVRTSIPIPRIHAYACDSDNPFGHPYLITDFARGIRLVDIWNDPDWWTGMRNKKRCLGSLARHMTELAALEFDSIGRLDRLHGHPDDPYIVAPFPSRLAFNPDLQEPDGPLGPFTTLQAYLRALLSERRRGGDSTMLALLSIFLAALPDAQFDGAPFIFGHPDFDSQNVFVDDATAEVSAIIDWDGVAIVPRQLGALTYPAWLTVDWDPIMYPSYQEQPNHDSESDLHMYRRMYVDAIDTASGGRYTAVTRNSHVVSALENAVRTEFTTGDIVYHLGKFVFGSSAVTFEVMEGIKHGAWFGSRPDEVVQVKERNGDSDGNSDQGGGDQAEIDRTS